MASRPVRIEPYVADILKRATVSGAALKLNGQLDRSTYEAVDKAIKAIGGRWDKKTRSHLFRPGVDVSELIASATASGMVVKNPNGYFATPYEVIARMLDLAEMEDPDAIAKMRILEPSAGDGAIIRILDQVVACEKIVACEVDPILARSIEESATSNDVEVIVGDFLSLNHEQVGTFDRILMNPPFSVTGAPLAWFIHVMHAYWFLAPKGRLVAVTPSSWVGDRSSLRGDLASFRDFVDTYGSFEMLPEGAFAGSGTQVRTCVVVLEN